MEVGLGTIPWGEAGELCAVGGPQEASVASCFPGTREFYFNKIDILEREFILECSTFLKHMAVL